MPGLHSLVWRMLDTRCDVFDLWVKGLQVNQWLSKLLQLDLANLTCFNKNPVLLNGILCIMEKHVYFWTWNQHLRKLLITPKTLPCRSNVPLGIRIFWHRIAFELYSITLGESDSASERCRARDRLRSSVWMKATQSVMLCIGSCHFLRKYSEQNFSIFNTDTLKQ